MKRLFWKFFIFIWIAQMIGIVGVAATFWFKSLNRDEDNPRVDTSPPAAFMVGTVAAALENNGTETLKSLIERHDVPGVMHSRIYVVDDRGQDFLGRDIPPEAIARAQRIIERGVDNEGVRHVNAADGTRYLLFATRPEFRGARNRPPPAGKRLFPFKPVAATLLASLLCALLLAWYFSKPIRSMRAAFAAVAQGRLDTRLANVIGRRRDELADLGRNFDDMVARLQSLVEGQKRLLHDVSHELRSPLARLQVAVGLARQQPEKAGMAMDRIEQESIRIDQLVGQLLTLSRLEAGETQGMDEEVDMDEVLSTIVEDAAFEAAAKNQLVKLEGHCDAIVKGKAELLYHALENVVRNALKHSPVSGTVVVRADCRGYDGSLLLTVLDRGQGVPEEELEKIFSAFYRGGSGESTPGHGLGLAIARQAIQAHGGSIRALNRPRGGLCVEIRLPILQKGAAD